MDDIRINAVWVRSRACRPQNNCVELRIDTGTVEVRDSKNVDAAPLAFSHDQWAAFLVGFVR
jgi:Domain of unknown function (DUF397)